MTPEELLKPRYKVIADYPFNKHFKVGEILILFSFMKTKSIKDIEHYYHHGETHQNFEDIWFDCYPHLFRKLQWWEDRKPENMPEYVTNGENVLKVIKHFFDDRYSMPEFKPSIERCLLESGSSVRYDNYTPSTKEEYENQNK